MIRSEPKGWYRFKTLTQGNPQHPWLLFLHGFLGNRFEFRDVMATLAEDFFCVALDLPGHGQTIVSPAVPPVQAYSMEATAVGVLGCLAELQCQLGVVPHPKIQPEIYPKIHPKIGLLGYSLGGRLGLYLLLKFPQVFRGGLLESASPGLATPEERSLRLYQDRQRAKQLESLDAQGFQQFLQQWYRSPLFQGLPENPHYPALLQQRQTGKPPDLAQSLRYLSVGAQPSLWPELCCLELPLTLVVGEWDQKFVGINQAMSDRCPQAQLHIIPGVSHNVHQGQPNQFIPIVRSAYPCE